MPRFFRLRTAAPWLVAIFLGAGALVPTAAGAAEPVFPPASRIGLVPPPNFVLSANFPGFTHNDKQANILMAELPGYAYDNIEKEIAGELQRNPAAANRRDVPVKDGRGFVLKGTQTSPQGPLLKWTMVANAQNVTAVVTALIPEAVQEAASEQAILDSFASLTVRASVPVEEQLAALPFAMHDLAGFRIVRVQPGQAAMLTDGPSDAVEAIEQPLLVVSLGAAGTAPPLAERDGIARRMIGETPGLKDMKVVRSEPLRIANQQGHEILIEAKDAKTGTEVNAVQWLRFGSGTLLRIVGVARKDTWDSNFRRFRQVRDGLGSR